MMIKELDMVVLRESVPECGLNSGDIGTVVLVHKRAKHWKWSF
jgi:hypothetical protein